MANVIDKGFVHHRAVAQLWAEVALNLTESTVLPFDIQGYSAYLNASFNDIKLRYGDRLITNGANLGLSKSFELFEPLLARSLVLFFFSSFNDESKLFSLQITLKRPLTISLRQRKTLPQSRSNDLTLKSKFLFFQQS